MNEILKKIDGESEKECLYRIGEAKNNGLLDMTWQQIADWMNAEWRESETEYRTESAYRKLYRSFSDARQMFDRQQAENDGTNDKYIKQLHQLEKEKIKIQTEKLEYNKWLREDARDELIMEHICQAIREMEPLEVPEVLPANIVGRTHGERAGCLLLADAHYGAEVKICGLFGEILNEYSPDIFEERMWNLLEQVIDIIQKESLIMLNVYNLGDSTDGLLRLSQLMKLRYGVLESAIYYGRFITTWLNELTKHVNVKYQMVRDSNHDQLRLLNQPKNAFKNENVALIIAEKIMDRLEGNPNFEFYQNPTGYIFDKLVGYNVLGIHGEIKSLVQGVKDFSSTYKTPIDILIGGHKHHKNSENVAIESDVVSAPSIIGIDDYSMSLNKTSDPGATLLVIEANKGVSIEYNIKL